jgi:glyoxylate reductase
MTERKKVLVARRIPEKGIEMLARHFDVEVSKHDRTLTPEELRQHLAGCDGLVCLLQDKITAELLDAVPTLKIVSNVAVGFDNVDVPACTRRGVMVTNTPEVLTDTTADFAFALLLAATRRVAEADRFVRGGRFTEWRVDLLLGRDAHHATLGIFGMGRIGRAMARRARGFDMKILYYDDVRQPPEVEAELGLQFESKDTVLRESDFISLHVPLMPSTRHLIGEREFNLMKPSAILVNTARGPVVDEQALVDALNAGRIAGAGLDVFAREPEVNPGLLVLEQVVLAPHIASASIATRERMATLAAENCIAGLGGQTPPNLLNPDVLAARRR